MIKKILYFLPFLIIFLFLIYHYRYVYINRFDEEYARDLFDHSQYRIPHSPRSISDELLYQVAGVDYLKTGNVFDINPEKAPLAKYFYGFSIIIFQNAQIISIIIFFLAFVFYYRIAVLILKNKKLVFLASILFLTEPLIYSQIAISMLELPELLFFLMHIYYVLKLAEHKGKNKVGFFYLLMAGISLGGFSSIRFGFFPIVIILVDFLVAIKKKFIPSLIFILIIALIFYILTYAPYFFKGNTFIDFLKAQKWIINHYHDSWKVTKNKTIFGSIFIYFLTGFNKGWYEGATWEKIPEWTILWPIYLLFFIYSIKNIFLYFNFFLKKNNKNKQLKEIYIYLLTIFLFFLMIPISLFVRYLLLIMPLFILITVKKLPILLNKKFLLYLFFLILPIYITQQYFYLNPSPDSTIKEIKRQWENSTYQDFFDYLILDKKFDRYQFWQYMLSIEKKIALENKEITISTEKFFPWEKTIYGNIKIIYKTKLGKIINSEPIKFIKKQNRWYLVWHSNLIFSNFNYSDSITSKFELGEYGKIISPNDSILSEEGYWPFFLVLNNQVKNNQKLIKQLENLTGISAYKIEILYRANNLPNIPVEIGFLKEDFNIDNLKKIKLEEGIIIEKRKKRIYKPNKNCSFFLLKYLENKNKQLINPTWGGYIKIKKADGKEIILINKNKKDGKDFYIK